MIPLYVFLFFSLIAGALVAAHTETALPRTILAIYDGKYQHQPHETSIHKNAETPLNHLGYRLEYHEVHQPLPLLEKRDDVLGVLTWFTDMSELENPEDFFSWAIKTMDAGKKWVVMENLALSEGQESNLTFDLQEFWSRLGIRDYRRWNAKTYLTQFIVLDHSMALFERPYIGILPAYRQLEVLSPDCVAHVVARKGNDPKTDSCLVATGPQGGFVAPEYGLYVGYYGDKEYKQWMINPFHFFRLAYESHSQGNQAQQEWIPRADTTTLAGRRIYYSHIDGDGWNSLTQLESYRAEPVPCAEVIRQKIVEAYPDLPITIAPIGADVDLKWVGSELSRTIARQLFALPNVEVGSHTYTHPFDWPFFEHYEPSKEVPFLSLYPNGGWQNQNLLDLVTDRWKKFRQKALGEPFVYPSTSVNSNYEIPRAYALQPFNLELETQGAIIETNVLALPSNKDVKVYQWSGDCLPFEEALKKVHEAGVRNLNGGSTRFDDEYPSYSYVSALGRLVGKEQQIYASNSNENTYTELWTGRFYGFNKLPETFKNTETPIRLRPINLYFHMYSSERMPSLYALLSNISYIRKREMIPIPMSHFAGIVDGFYQAEFLPLSKRQWKVQKRGDLQTVRFDQASLLSTDFSRSQGVVGQRHFQGSLYIYLDKAVSEPIVALRNNDQFWMEPSAEQPYLIDSHWTIWDVTHHHPTAFSFKTEGFGSGEMRWNVPSDGVYAISTDQGSRFTIRSSNNLLAFRLENFHEPMKVHARLHSEIEIQ